MIKLENITYNKEYVELLQAFGYRDQDKINIRLEDTKLVLDINNTKISTNLVTRKINKSSIKNGLYILLNKATGIDLPWGMLVGVSPLKLFKNLEDKYGTAKASKILEDKYHLSKTKIELGYKTLDNQRDVYSNYQRGYSVYINIPFCPSRCSYCSYPTYVVTKEKEDRYIKTLLKEVEEVGKFLKKPPTTIYIGGGTPSAISVKNLEKIVKQSLSVLGVAKELTVEIGRPDTITKDLLLMLSNQQVDRISINPQTMSDDTLKRIGRNHTKKELIQVVNLARSIGDWSINMDLITGLPGEATNDFENSLKSVLNLEPENISIHNLALKKGANLWGQEKTAVEDFSKTRDRILKNTDYSPYYLYRQKAMVNNSENIGYSTMDKKCLYNILMMNDVHSIIGLGMASSTKIIDKKIHRSMNYRTINQYITQIDQQIEKKVQLIRRII